MVMVTNVEHSFMDLLKQCYDLAMRLDISKDDQPGVIGYFPVYFPEELVHAAGLRPHALLGGGNKLEVRLADARIGSFVCSICRSTTELGLNGSLSGMKDFFTQPICDAAKHMAGIWGRNFAAQPSQRPMIVPGPGLQRVGLPEPKVQTICPSGATSTTRLLNWSEMSTLPGALKRSTGTLLELEAVGAA